MYVNFYECSPTLFKVIDVLMKQVALPKYCSTWTTHKIFSLSTTKSFWRGNVLTAYFTTSHTLQVF